MLLAARINRIRFFVIDHYFSRVFHKVYTPNLSQSYRQTCAFAQVIEQEFSLVRGNEFDLFVSDPFADLKAESPPFLQHKEQYYHHRVGNHYLYKVTVRCQG